MKYEELLKEEGKSYSDLPQQIKAKINGLKLTVGRVSAKPALQENVTRLDIAICDMIQDWIEKDLPAEPTPQTETAEQKTAREAKEAEAKAKSDKEALEAKEKADKEALEIAEQNKITELQNAIVAKINASSQRAIEHSDLTNLLGRAPKDRESVGTLRLHKVFLAQRWKAM